MRIRAAAVSLVLAAAVVHGFGVREAEARTPLIVKKFLLGRYEYGPGSFVATGARGTQNAYRDNVILLVFSGPVDFYTLDSRTVRIGVPSSNGLFVPAEGAFLRYSTHYTGKVRRNRVLFDPTFELGCPFMDTVDHGFRADTEYTVTIPGADAGGGRIVTGTDGTPMGTTFTTTFRTTDEYMNPYLASQD